MAFHPVRAPSAEQLQTLLNQIIKRVMKLLKRSKVMVSVLTFQQSSFLGLKLPYCPANCHAVHTKVLTFFRHRIRSGTIVARHRFLTLAIPLLTFRQWHRSQTLSSIFSQEILSSLQKYISSRRSPREVT